MIRQLVCIVCIIVLIRINEGTSHNDCMVTIAGPIKNVSQRPEDVDNLLVNELEPAEFYCEFTRHDSDESKHRYRVYIDIISINPSLPPERERIFLTAPESPTPRGFNFNITNTNINSTEHVTIYRTKIIFLSINLHTPILIAKCAIEYFPDGNPRSANKTNCSSSTTFAIIPNNTCPTNCNPGPIVTTGPMSSRSTSLSIDTSPIVSKSEFGSTVGVLCSIVMAETALIIIFIIYQFMKYKKSRGSKNDVVPMHATNACMCRECD